MIRFLTMLATVLFLSSAYFLYTVFVVPFTLAQQVAPSEEIPQITGYQPPVLAETAAEFFSDVPWLQSGELKTFQSKNMLFYTRDVERDESTGNQVKMSPIAVLWSDPRRPDEKPFRLIAEKGIVQFENQFFDRALQLKNAKPGRIVWATLQGVVHIDGPDGLVIDGKQFVFSEQSGQLYSDYPVSFQYGPTENDKTEVIGTADQLNLSLARSDEAVLGKDMPRVAGVSLMTLRKNVKLDAVFFQKGIRHEAHLTCDGPFEYNVLEKRASFNNRVSVTHRYPKRNRNLSEKLDSELLTLQFQQATEIDVNELSGELFDDLVLSKVSASGSTGVLGDRTSQVRVQSDQHDLIATMQEMAYDVMARTATFLDPVRVLVRRGETTFDCPNVTVVHTEDRRLERLECRGPGKVYVTHEQFGNSHAEASWEGRVNVFPDGKGPLHIVELLKNAQVVIPAVENSSELRSYEMGIAAEQLRLWINLDKAQQLENSKQVLLGELPIHRAEAVGKVAMVSKDLIVEKAGHINVSLSKGIVPATVERKNGVVGANFSNSNQKSSRTRKPIRVSTDQIQINLIHDPGTGKIAMKKIDGRGNVTIKHQPASSKSLQRLGGDSPIVLKGTRVVAESSGPDDHRVTLLGVVDKFGDVTTPAEMNFGSTIILGANLTFDRNKNQVAILGPGKFQLPVTRDLNGKALDQPATLEVVWQERMIFDGQQANFLEAVTCSLKGHQENRSRMTCDDLSIQLTHKISFSEKPETRQKVDVETIHARYGVEVESWKLEGTKLVAVHRGQLAEFNINQTTGTFVGVGPGEIHSWSLGNKLKLTPTNSTQANQPIRSEEDQKWRYTRLVFSGKLTGNFEQQTAAFDQQRIRIVSAPVKKALVKFREDDVSLISDAVRLDCRSLKIFQKKFNGRDYWELFAENVDELEGQVFRAVADELSFDERLGRFILRGIGKDATLYFQERPGAQPSPSSHRYIEFIPKTRSITVDGSSGLSG